MLLKKEDFLEKLIMKIDLKGHPVIINTLKLDIPNTGTKKSPMRIDHNPIDPEEVMTRTENITTVHIMKEVMGVVILTETIHPDLL